MLSPSAVKALAAYDWPGNVRELQNVLASMQVAGPQRGVIGPHSLPGSHCPGGRDCQSKATLAEARRAFESRFVRAALLRAGGRATMAARELGVSRQGLAKLHDAIGSVDRRRPGDRRVRLDPPGPQHLKARMSAGARFPSASIRVDDPRAVRRRDAGVFADSSGARRSRAGYAR